MLASGIADKAVSRNWLAVLWLSLLLSGCEARRADRDITAFLETHWQDPLPAQGTPPAAFSDIEASLSPEACASCHAEQHRDWRTALHSRTMGAGIRWQFELLGQEEGNRCLRCHAPLAEQKALVAMAEKWPNAPVTAPPAYVPATLAHDGLTCAACHVRGHVRYGPPSRTPAVEGAPHGGFVASTAFEDSRFCAHCHQFPEDGPRLAGKLREDTYGQWKASAHAPKTPCQSCHMPDRRHLWRGIHDPEMVRKALAVELKLKTLPNGLVQADVTARNQGAGHHLPTYMVPKIYLVLVLSRPGLPDFELARDVIGWQADLDMAKEEFDTRIPAGESRHYRHAFPPPTDGSEWQVEVRVDVAPREHYERMFRHSRTIAKLSSESSRLLDEAIAEAVATRFTALRVTAKP